jgi:hypothetical protein
VSCLEFASYYQDGMVLQREPASAVIWGTGELLGDLDALLECSFQGIHILHFIVIAYYYSWV